MSTLLLDTHVVHWWSAERRRISAPASAAIESADELAVSDVTWWELAWLATHGRLTTTTPVLAWLRRLAAEVRTIPITPAIAATAVDLPESFPGDPADRLIYSTAIEIGAQLVTKDERLRAHPAFDPRHHLVSRAALPLAILGGPWGSTSRSSTG